MSWDGWPDLPAQYGSAVPADTEAQVTDLPTNAIRFPRKPVRLVKADHQGERTLSSLHGSVLAINPTGMDINEIIEMERRRQRYERLAKARNNFADAYSEMAKEDSLEGAHAWACQFLGLDTGGKMP